LDSMLDKARLDDLESKLAELKETVDVAWNRIEELEKAVAEIRESVKAFDKGLEGVVFRLDGLEAAVDTLYRKVGVKVEEKEKREKMRVEEVVNLFPEDYRKLLDFKVEGEYVVASPKRYLSSENFAEIARIVRQLGGEYISAGKSSHFKIPRKKKELPAKEEAGSEPGEGEKSLENLVRSAWNAGKEYTKTNGKWVFSDEYKALKEALKKQGKSMVVAVDGREYRVRLSGDQDKFIGIFPRKRRRA